MPIYEYECGDCGNRLEAIQKVSDAPLTDCPTCGQARLRRLVSAAGFQLKGTGWYATDFKHNGRKKEPGKDKGEGTPSGADGAAPEKKTHSCAAGACGCAH